MIRSTAMRWFLVVLALALAIGAALSVFEWSPQTTSSCGPANAPPPTTLEDLLEHPETERAFAILQDFHAAQAAVDAGDKSRKVARDREKKRFLSWLNETPRTLGVDLRGKPDWVIELLDRTRVDILSRRDWPRGEIEYVKIVNPRGMERLEYAVLLPETYTPRNDDRYPLVLSLHERVINPAHPAFRGLVGAGERSRVPIHNGWLDEPTADSAVVIAPTGSPNGLRFTEKSHFDDLQLMYVTLGESLAHFRTDWNRVFLELHGSALRVACEQALLFAGIILRDRENEKQLAIPEEELFMLENLNGTPFLYIADNARWADVGAPLSAALKAAYAKAGKPQNLIVQRCVRDTNGALKGDPEEIARFVTTHRLTAPRKSFSWRYFNPGMAAPMPISVGSANYDYDKKLTLEQAAGAIRYDAKTIQDGETKLNVIDIQCTEARELTLALWDGPVDLSFPVTVTINGVVIHDKVKVERDWDYFFDIVSVRHFFMVPVVGTLECQFEFRSEAETPASVQDPTRRGK